MEKQVNLNRTVKSGNRLKNGARLKKAIVLFIVICASAVVWGQTAKECFDKGNAYFDQKNYTQAKYWYEKSAERGYFRSLMMLGAMYMDNEYVVKTDYEKAKELLKKAYEQLSNYTNTDALYPVIENQLGVCYDLDDNKDNDSQAAYWYQKAAERGHSLAQMNLGYLYYEGRGVKEDGNVALYWMEKAIENKDNKINSEMLSDCKSVISDLKEGGYFSSRANLSSSTTTTATTTTAAPNRTATPSAPSPPSPSPVSTEYVLINGVKWATRNVGTTPKTFTSQPEDNGGYYTWEQAKTACPVGWRLPTKSELQKLIDAGYVWTTLNAKNGGIFGRSVSSIFLPAAGAENIKYSIILFEGRMGFYWSSTEFKHVSNAINNLSFCSKYPSLDFQDKIVSKSCVRCVKE